MYRVGLPFWKTAARAGIPLLVRVQAHYDAETSSYWADSPDLDGLVVSGGDLDELQAEATAGAGVLIGLAGVSSAARIKTELRFRCSAICTA